MSVRSLVVKFTTTHPSNNRSMDDVSGIELIQTSRETHGMTDDVKRQKVRFSREPLKRILT